MKLEVGFSRTESGLERTIQIGDRSYESLISLAAAPKSDSDHLSAWWHAYLRNDRPDARNDSGELKVAELFCGPGGLAQGVKHFCDEVGLKFRSVAAADTDADAVSVYSANHGTPREGMRAGPQGDSAELVSYEVSGTFDNSRFPVRPELLDPGWEKLVGGVDLLLAGPPCQGHSNLNNHTRRNDRRNGHYLDVPALAVALDCPAVIIENVPAVRWSHEEVVAKAEALFRSEGYKVKTGVMKAHKMGWPQRRNRFFMVATREAPPICLDKISEVLKVDEPLDLWWAIKDLETIGEDAGMHRQPKRSIPNKVRIDYLFDNDVYDLPDEKGPLSRSAPLTDPNKKAHTYPSVYGRLRKFEVAPTITSGFMTNGRGRYVHPTMRRTLNPREAARLQGFPDGYDFEPDGKRPDSFQLLKWIGDAVPMPLGYAATLSALGERLSGPSGP
jgi:DNA (cytosine-5)-methyltransferase 1